MALGASPLPPGPARSQPHPPSRRRPSRMKLRRSTAFLVSLLVCLVGARPAHATFHLMQIEQVIGGVNGDITAQAIQLRMRATGENQVSQGRINVRDAAGLNPILI